MQKMNSHRVHLNTPVTSVVRGNGKVIVTSSRGDEPFDHVIFACHADTSLEMLQDAAPLESKILQNFEFSKNTVTLHSDLSVSLRHEEADVVNAYATESMDFVELYYPIVSGSI